MAFTRIHGAAGATTTGSGSGSRPSPLTTIGSSTTRRLGGSDGRLNLTLGSQAAASSQLGGGRVGDAGASPFVRLDIEFDVRNAPPSIGDFIMIDHLLVEPEHASVAQLRSLADDKLKGSLGMPFAGFQLFFQRDGGSRYLFDTQLFDELLAEMEESGKYRLKLLLMLNLGAQAPGGSINPTSPLTPPNRVAAPPSHHPVSVGLTEAALNSLAATGKVDPQLAYPLYTVDDLAQNKGATRGTWRFQGIVRMIRRKNDKIVEVELEDAKLLGNRCITAVSYDSAASNMLATLEKGRAVEVRNARAAPKSATDVKFQTNPHLYRIIVDTASTIVIVSTGEAAPPRQMLVDASSTAGSSAVRTLGGGNGGTPSVISTSLVSRAVPKFGGPPSLAGGVAPTLASLPPSSASERFFAAGGAPSVMSSGSGGTIVSASRSSAAHSGGASTVAAPKRTLFTASLSAAVTANPNSPAGMAAAAATETAQYERMLRDRHVSMQQARSDLELSEIKRKARVNPACAVCGFDLDSGESVRRLQQQVALIKEKNPGCATALLTDLQALFGDQRPSTAASSGATPLSTPPSQGARPRRVVCSATVVHPVTRSHHCVHVRCAHVASMYQRGDDLTDALLEASMTQCAICGERGAATQCYHPDCKKWFHSSCAILTAVPGGYVDFGPRDPLLPKPSCPAHKFVPTNRPGGSLAKDAKDALIQNGSGTATLFDSNVVEHGELRDPDEEEEED